MRASRLSSRRLLPYTKFRAGSSLLRDKLAEVTCHSRELRGGHLRGACARAGLARCLGNAGDVVRDLCAPARSLGDVPGDLVRRGGLLLDGAGDRMLDVVYLADDG